MKSIRIVAQYYKKLLEALWPVRGKHKKRRRDKSS
jgi:hypothetical protein